MFVNLTQRNISLTDDFGNVSETVKPTSGEVLTNENIGDIDDNIEVFIDFDIYSYDTIKKLFDTGKVKKGRFFTRNLNDLIRLLTFFKGKTFPLIETDYGDWDCSIDCDCDCENCKRKKEISFLDFDIEENYIYIHYKNSI